jgi:acyl carrier protein
MLDERLKEIVQDVLGDDQLELDERTTAKDVPGWDSLAHINIMVSVESEFGVSFSTDQLSRFRDLGELQDFLHRRSA